MEYFHTFNSLWVILVLQIGSSGQLILAEVGTKVLYSVSSGSRDHITASFVVGADNTMVPPRVIMKGVRNVALSHLKDLPKNGLSGKENIKSVKIHFKKYYILYN